MLDAHAELSVLIAALSDGAVSPLVQVQARGSGKVILENASLIGRTANVALPDLTPVYLAKLLGFGLLAIGPEARELEHEYEILMAEDIVRAALKAKEIGALGARVTRHTIGLSDLGKEFWAATQPTG